MTVETDTELRQFLALDGGGKKGDLSKFVEDAVKARIFELSAERAKAANDHLSEAEIEAAVTEALVWARNRWCLSYSIPISCSVQ